jgi:hypothetical protein
LSSPDNMSTKDADNAFVRSYDLLRDRTGQKQTLKVCFRKVGHEKTSARGGSSRMGEANVHVENVAHDAISVFLNVAPHCIQSLIRASVSAGFCTWGVW